MHFAIKPLGSALHGAATMAKLTKTVQATVSRAAGAVVPVSDAPAPEAIVLLAVLTGGAERAGVAYIRAARLRSVALLWHDTQNSLPAALELASWCAQQRIPCRLLGVSGASAQRELRGALRTLRAAEEFRAARLGLIGGVSDWLVGSGIPRAFLKRQGMHLHDIPLRVLEHAYRRRLRVKEHAGTFAQVPREIARGEWEKAELLAAALADVVAHKKLDAFSIRCFDLLGSIRVTGCLGLSALLSRGIIAGCEGDVPSMLTLLAAQRVTGEEPVMLNPSAYDRAARRLALAHCTAPLGCVEPASRALRTHFESDASVAVAGRMRAGVYTLCKLGFDADGELAGVLAVRGKALRQPLSVQRCRVQLTLQLDEPLDNYLRHPYGNHLVAVRGDHRAELNHFLELMR